MHKKQILGSTILYINDYQCPPPHTHTPLNVLLGEGSEAGGKWGVLDLHELKLLHLLKQSHQVLLPVAQLHPLRETQDRGG